MTTLMQHRHGACRTLVVALLALTAPPAPDARADGGGRAALAGSLPQGVVLDLPFASGTKVEVVAGHGPRSGSPYHRGVLSPARNNDHFALDLAVTSEPQALVLEPVGGVVVRAGWASGAWRGYGRFVVVRYRFPGVEADYHVTYAHLSEIADGVSVGARLRRGQQIGRVGRSCDGATSCERLRRPHLHWVIHLGCRLGPAPGGGCFGGRAVPPAPLRGLREAPSRGDVLTSRLTTP